MFDDVRSCNMLPIVMCCMQNVGKAFWCYASMLLFDVQHQNSSSEAAKLRWGRNRTEVLYATSSLKTTTTSLYYIMTLSGNELDVEIVFNGASA